MDLELTDKAVLITGGSKGIGLACARRFAAEGARVAIASRDDANLSSAAEALAASGVDVVTVRADLKDPGQAASMADMVESELGPLDVLVNAAGAARRESPRGLTSALWHDAMEAKYFTYIHAMDAVLPRMVDRHAGAVVNVIGTGGKLATPTHLTGGAANAALMLVTAGLANAFAADGVRINGVNPGLTETDRIARTIETQAELEKIPPEEARRRLVERLPIGRLARPDEVADVVVFLASARASYVTGALVSLDAAATPTGI